LVDRIRTWVSFWARPKEMGNEDNHNKEQRKYENIGPTAALVAYYRSASDIPFAKEVAREINAEEISQKLTTKDQLLLPKMQVMQVVFEARFKSVDAVLGQYPYITQVMEIPAGFSTRGMAMTVENPAITYIECDLAPMLQEKQKLVSNIFTHRGNGVPPHLHFHIASILEEEQLNSAVSTLNAGPLAIITEGLLSYLTPQEKVIAAKNMRALLATHGGVWIVTDLTRVFRPDDQMATELRNRISAATGFSPITGCFASISEARRFFKHLGFKVRAYRRSDVMHKLSSRTAPGLNDHAIRKLLKPQSTFALEIAKK